MLEPGLPDLPEDSSSFVGGSHLFSACYCQLSLARRNRKTKCQSVQGMSAGMWPPRRQALTLPLTLSVASGIYLGTPGSGSFSNTCQRCDEGNDGTSLSGPLQQKIRECVCEPNQFGAQGTVGSLHDSFFFL